MRHQYILKRTAIKLVSALAALVLIVGYPAIVSAVCSDPNQQSCSPSYGVSETFFGTGGQLCDPTGGTGTSPNYCAKSSVGELGVGNTLSPLYQAQAGFNTNREPWLAIVVTSANVNAGVLTPGSTAHATAAFSVGTYLASGYVVQVVGPAPTNSGHQLTPITTAAASNATQEQFGMNLVANSTGCATPAPANFGSNPVQVPDSTFSFGSAYTGYDTCGKFQYNSGDIIAHSLKSSGETDYTISYIFNITNLTPGGTYTASQSLVATSTF